MQQLTLAAIPNQRISYQDDENFYVLNFSEIEGLMCVDVNIDGQDVLLGQRIVSNEPLIPYQYLENGNFVIVTDNEEYPYYTQFGITQFLIYATQEEIDAIQANATNTTA